jgi:hypothetical protein
MPEVTAAAVAVTLEPLRIPLEESTLLFRPISLMLGARPPLPPPLPPLPPPVVATTPVESRRLEARPTSASNVVEP